jgi:hypothetical protein
MNKLFELILEKFKDNPDIEIVHRSDLHLSDYGKSCPEQLGDWAEGDYLIVMDKKDGKRPLSGAYSIDIIPGKNELEMIWLPFPEEPIVGQDNIINHLKQNK